MKLLKKQISAKDGTGFILLRPETAEDLWHSYNLLQIGDCVRCTTVRKVVKGTSTGSTSSNKKRMMLTVEVENFDIDPDVLQVRISGTVKAESEHVRMGQYHTLTLELNKNYSIEKQCWDQISLDRIDKAVNLDRQAEIAAIVMQKKRGLSDSAKPTRIQVEAAIEKQEVKTAQLAKASADEKSKAKGAQTGKPKLDPTLKQDLKPKDPLTTIKTCREIKKIVQEAAAFTRGTKAIAAIPLAGKAPSRKAVNAAVDAMEKAGYTVPEGMQMVITLAPTDVTDLAISSKLESQKEAADVDMEPIATAEKSGKAPRGRGRGRAK